MDGQHQDKKIGFKAVHLYKDQILGVGSYGKVCRAECDDLPCAAKLIHETLFDPTALNQIAPQREHRQPIRRFEKECEFLSTIKHPNIIQYLGTYQDVNTHLPVLLMELMDDSLTDFLENSPQPIFYHIQVNISHDITLALSFLHSNGIIHRDLSGNNVLMMGNIRAKVTDFGMARLGELNPRASRLTFTMCPGTDVYMPPEAVKDNPTYTEKIDCFSFGVIAIQIMTKLFPQPGNRRMEVEIENVGVLEKRIPEYERRQDHISKVDPNHPLLEISLNCLKDNDIERPSAQELSRGVAVLKRNLEYSESVRLARESQSTKLEQDASAQREEALRQQLEQQIEDLQQIIRSQLTDLEQTITQKDETIAAGLLENQQLREQHREETQLLEREKDREIEELGMRLEQVVSQQARAEERINELEQQLKQKDEQPTQQSAARKRTVIRGNIKWKWSKENEAPCKMSRCYTSMVDAAVDGNVIYVMEDYHVYAYTASTCIWSQLPDCIFRSCSSAIVNNFLTLVGGYHDGTTTNKLFSLTMTTSTEWTGEFPPMPTKRWGASALCTGTDLIVAGGQGDKGHPLSTIEVMNTETHQWSTAVDLPQPTVYGSLVQCVVDDDRICMIGGLSLEKSYVPIKPGYTCSLSALLQSCSSKSLGTHLARFLSKSNRAGVWSKVADIPAISSTYVSLHGQLLAIGGRDSNFTRTTAVHMYNASTDSWDVISHMSIPRQECYAAVLSDNRLIVVGGMTAVDTKTDAIEIATSL